MYEALISDLQERLENFPTDGFSLDYCRIRGACDAMEAMNEKLAALQAENGSKDKEIERLQVELQYKQNECDSHYGDYCEAKAELSRVEAERDAAMKDLKEIADNTGDGCQYCKHLPCYPKHDHCIGFEWRGAQGEG